MNNEFFLICLFNYWFSCDSRIFFDFFYMVFNGRWGNWRRLIVIFKNTICGWRDILSHHMSIVLRCMLNGYLIVPLHTHYCGDLCGSCFNFRYLLYLLLFVFFLFIFFLVNLHNYCMLLLRHLLLFFLILHYNILINVIYDAHMRSLFFGIFNGHYCFLDFVMGLLSNLIDYCCVGSGSWVSDAGFFTQTGNKLLGLIQGLHVWGQGGWQLRLSCWETSSFKGLSTLVERPPHRSEFLLLHCCLGPKLIALKILHLSRWPLSSCPLPKPKLLLIDTGCSRYLTLPDQDSCRFALLWELIEVGGGGMPRGLGAASHDSSLLRRLFIGRRRLLFNSWAHM